MSEWDEGNTHVTQSPVIDGLQAAEHVVGQGWDTLQSLGDAAHAAGQELSDAGVQGPDTLGSGFLVAAGDVIGLLANFFPTHH